MDAHCNNNNNNKYGIKCNVELMQLTIIEKNMYTSDKPIFKRDINYRGKGRLKKQYMHRSVRLCIYSL